MYDEDMIPLEYASYEELKETARQYLNFASDGREAPATLDCLETGILS